MPKVRWKTGVYRIRNLVNNKVYVGGAYTSFGYRFNIHRRDLNNNSHCNAHLQAAWNKYGEDCFKFEVIERCHSSKVKEREQYWLDRIKPTDNRVGYNLSPTAGSPLGVKHTEDSRANFSAAMRKRMESEEERYKVGNAMRGKKHTEEAKAKISASLVESWKDEERRKKQSEATRGQKRTPETCRNISEALTGRKLSPEHAAKCGNGNRGRKQSPEEIAKRAASLTGKKRTPEQCERIAASLRGKKKSPEAVANATAAIRASRATESKEERKKYGKANVGVNRRSGGKKRGTK